MNARIYSQKGANRLIDNAIIQAYERRERSVDFLLLFSVKETEKEKLLTMVKENPLVLSGAMEIWDSLIVGLCQNLGEAMKKKLLLLAV